MSDRVKGLHVAFEINLNEDDTKRIIDAIKLIKGVMSVKTKEVVADDWIIRSRIKNEFSGKLIEMLEDF